MLQSFTDLTFFIPSLLGLCRFWAEGESWPSHQHSLHISIPTAPESHAQRDVLVWPIVILFFIFLFERLGKRLSQHNTRRSHSAFSFCRTQFLFFERTMQAKQLAQKRANALDTDEQNYCQHFQKIYYKTETKGDNAAILEKKRTIKNIELKYFACIRLLFCCFWMQYSQKNRQF